MLLPFMNQGQQLANSIASSYSDSLQQYRKAYILNHEVVAPNDSAMFDFFPIDEQYRIIATFTPTKNGKWFSMKTSGSSDKIFRTYGKINFMIEGRPLELKIYQSQSLMVSDEHRDHLFLPFTDQTSGISTYESGRYIDLNIPDIQKNHVVIDFNKAYNPYCVYTTGYNCPIPPAENFLDIPIRAGEKNFRKSVSANRVPEVPAGN